MRKWMKFISNRICTGNGELLVRLVMLGIALVWTAGAIAGEDQKPKVSISLVGTADGIVEQGEPIRVTVKLGVNDGETTSFVIWPESGDWTDAVSVYLFDADGEQTGSGQVLGSPDESGAVLAPDRIAGGLWRFSGGSMEGIPAGDYIIRARLAVSVAALGSEGWTGEVFSNELPIDVVAPSGDPERLAQRTLALASDDILDGRLEEAAAILDSFLNLQPKDLEAWMLRGLVCEAAGNLGGALLCVNKAQVIYNSYGLGESDIELHAMQTRIIAAMMEPSAAMAPEPPAWSWPPAELLRRESRPGLPATEGPPPELGGETDEPPAEDPAQANTPSNDQCQNAEFIAEVVNQAFNTSYATFDGQGYCIRGPNIWYRYFALSTCNVTVSLCGSSYDTMLAIYEGSECYQQQSNVIGCNDDACGQQSEFTFSATAGKEYLIEVGGFDNSTGQGVISIFCDSSELSQSGLNDNCQNAEPIGNVTGMAFDTRNATFDGPGHCMISPNIWYIYTATCTGQATLSLCGSSYDTKLAVYDGTACDPSLRRLIECNDDSCGLQSEITFDVTAGQQYLIEVGGFGYDIGQGLISVSCEGTAQTGKSDLVDAPRQ